MPSPSSCKKLQEKLLDWQFLYKYNQRQRRTVPKRTGNDFGISPETETVTATYHRESFLMQREASKFGVVKKMNHTDKADHVGKSDPVEALVKDLRVKLPSITDEEIKSLIPTMVEAARTGTTVVEALVRAGMPVVEALVRAGIPVVDATRAGIPIVDIMSRAHFPVVDALVRAGIPAVEALVRAGGPESLVRAGVQVRATRMNL